jgi:heme-degrading monooxygenase HmoA
MVSTTTLTFFRFPNLKSKLWAFGQMQFAHSFIAKSPGLIFYKLMGSGRDIGFSIFPDWGVYALLGVWDNEQAANDFFNHSAIYKRYQRKSSEQWTIFMKPIQTKGLWSGGNPFTISSALDSNNPLIAVITRATIKPNKLLKFWRFVPISQRPIQRGCEGLIYTKGVGEAPVIQMATFSVWENLDALKKYAYNSLEHREAIKKTHQIDWYKEEMFTRFQPFKTIGTWEGKDLLAHYLNSEFN